MQHPMEGPTVGPRFQKTGVWVRNASSLPLRWRWTRKGWAQLPPSGHSWTCKQ